VGACAPIAEELALSPSKGLLTEANRARSGDLRPTYSQLAGW